MPHRARLFSTITVAAVLAGGCNIATQSGRRTAIAAGLITTAIGAGLAIAVRADEPRTDDCFVTQCLERGFEWQAKFYGALGLAAAGAILTLVGAASNPPDEPAQPAAIAMTAEPSTLDAPSLAIAAARTYVTPAAAVRPRPLPEVATDATTLQFAKQARGAAMRGDCATAAIVLARIESRDRTYLAALVASGVVAPCR